MLSMLLYYKAFFNYCKNVHFSNSIASRFNINDQYCGASVIAANPLVIHGAPSHRGEFPFLVALYKKEAGSKKINFHCGATLVSNRHIITAAHCVKSTDELHPVKSVNNS